MTEKNLAKYIKSPDPHIQKATSLSDLDLRREYYRLSRENRHVAQIYGDELANRVTEQQHKIARSGVRAAWVSAVAAFLVIVVTTLGILKQ